MSEKKLTILVVDDEAIVRSSLQDWFREEGYEVDVAENGVDALRRVAEKPYDVALLDIKMPKMDGLELQTRLAAARTSFDSDERAELSWITRVRCDPSMIRSS